MSTSPERLERIAVIAWRGVARARTRQQQVKALLLAHREVFRALRAACLDTQDPDWKVTTDDADLLARVAIERAATLSPGHVA
jgi:hypothetical protein